MLSKPLQFQLGPTKDEIKIIFPSQLRAFGITQKLDRDILEVFAEVGGTNQVFSLIGKNLQQLWPELIFNRRHSFVTSFEDYKESLCIDRIIIKDRLTVDSLTTFHPDPNKSRSDCLQLETRLFRHVWPLRYLERFSLQRNRKFLLQFAGDHAYVLTAVRTAYTRIS